MPRPPALLVAASLVVAGAALAGALPDPVREYPRLLLAAAVMAAGWILGARTAARNAGRHALPLVLATGVLARAALLAPPEPLSDDLYRYLWDGRVGNAGLNPFSAPPSDVSLAALRDDVVWSRINHPDVPTIYPPAAQVLFRTLDALAPRPRSPRVAAAIADLVASLLLAALLARRGRPSALALVHAWCPLAVLESAGGGHVDAAGAVLLVGAMLAAEPRGARPAGAGRGVAAGALLALSALVKPMAVFAAPALHLAGRGPQGAALAAGALLGALVVAPYLGAGRKLFTGLVAYAEHWQFLDAIYGPLLELGAPPRVARAALAAGMVAAAVGVPLVVRDPLAALAPVLGLVLFLSPTVHAWYAVWLVPFLPFAPRAVRPALFGLVALLPLAYAAAWHRARTEEWVEPAWTAPLIWGGALALLAAEGIRRARRPRGAAA